jgi:hypothetical protein
MRDNLIILAAILLLLLAIVIVAISNRSWNGQLSYDVERTFSHVMRK